MSSELNWQTLNAYVDGELSAREAAEVADAVTQDPEIARQVALLTSLKASVAATQPRFDAGLIGVAPRRRRKRLSPLAVAAAVLVFIGGLAVVLAPNTHLMPPPAGIALAESLHLEWLRSLDDEQRSQEAQVLKSSLDSLRLDAYIPDLSQVQLEFNGVRRAGSEKGTGLHVGYRGPSGCRVSLVIFPGREGGMTELKRHERNGLPVYQWTAGRSSFHLLAYSMDPTRFEQVAQVVYRLTRNRLPLDSHSILAMTKARAESRPCSA